MVDFARFPDAEAVTAQALKAAGVCSGRVYSSMPNTPTFPLAVVRRLGGAPAVERWLDAARIQVDVWGNNKSEARAAADAARVALHRAEGTTSAALNAFVSAVEDELGLTYLPDPDTGRDRYLFAVRVSAHTTFTT